MTKTQFLLLFLNIIPLFGVISIIIIKDHPLIAYMDFYVYPWLGPTTQFLPYVNPTQFWMGYNYFPYYQCGSGSGGCYY
jgi:hypothetical protein